MSKINPNAPKGSAYQPEGTMPASMLAAHKLKAGECPTGRLLDPKELNGWTHRRTMKRLIEQMATYRVLVHGVDRDHLARPLVLGARYFCDRQRVERSREAETPDTANAV